MAQNFEISIYTLVFMTEFATNRSDAPTDVTALTRVRLVGGLNKLVETNEERLQEYTMAIAETHDFHLRQLLQRHANQAKDFISILCQFIHANGGEHITPCPKTKPKSVWQNIMRMLSLSNQQQILKSCEYRESIAAQTYKHLMTLHQWPYDIFLELRMQKQQIEDAFNDITRFTTEGVLTK